jgi:hypothetical protein
MKRFYSLCLTAIFMAVAWTANAQVEVIDLSTLTSGTPSSGTGWGYNGSTTLTITAGGEYEIIPGTGSPATPRLSVNADNVSITLKGVTLDGISSVAKSGVVLILESSTTNVLSTGGLTITAAGNLTIQGDGKLTMTGAVSNSGTLDINGAEISVGGNLTNSGTACVMNITNGTIIDVAGAVSNSGTLDIDGAEISVGGNFANPSGSIAIENSEIEVTGNLTNQSSNPLNIHNSTIKVTGNLGSSIMGSINITGDVGVITVNRITNSNTVIDGDVVIKVTNTANVPKPVVDNVTKNKGIIFESFTSGTVGTVYGNVTLQTNLEIVSGESLTVPAGSTLTVPDGVELKINGGTMAVDVGGTFEGKLAGTLTGSIAIPSTIYYGDVVNVDISSLSITGVSGVGVDLSDFVYAWTGQGTITNEATYKVEGDDIYSLSNQEIKVEITSAYYNQTTALASAGVQVQAKPVNITAINVPGKVYDKTNVLTGSDAAKVTFVTNDILSGDEDGVTIICTGGTFGSIPAGDNVQIIAITGALQGLKASWYDLQTISSSLLPTMSKIFKKDITVSAGHFTIKDKVYDGTSNVATDSIIVTIVALNDAADGIISGDAVTLKTTTSNMVASYDRKEAGNRTVTITSGIELDGADAGNYNVLKSAPISANILPAPQSPIEYVWPTAIINSITLPSVTRQGVPIRYTVFPPDAATVVNYVLSPLKGGELVLTAIADSDPNYAPYTETHRINVSSPSRTPTPRMITLPAVQGIVTDPPAGMHYVESGKDFTFKLSPAAGREFAEVPAVSTDLAEGPEIIVTPNGDGSYTVRIVSIRKDIEVRIEAPVTPSTGNVTLSDNLVWSAGGRLYIRAIAPGEAQVYALSGARVKVIRYAAGETVTELPAGLYLVKAYGKVWKIAITE